jgi:hypothetical protein
LQYGLKEHRRFHLKGLDGATNIQVDERTGEIAIPFAGLAMKPDASGNWPINICRSSQTKTGVGYYCSSWGILKEKITLHKPNFFPANIIQGMRTERGVYDLFQEVAGIAQPSFSKKELKKIQATRRKQ